MTTTDLSYPIGRFSGEQVTTANRKRILLEIAELPGRLRDAIEGLSDANSIRPIVQEGWTVRQVVHHLADSHLHSYMRTRFALTENEPTIMPFDENAWANLKDARSGPIEPSLLLLRRCAFSVGTDCSESMIGGGLGAKVRAPRAGRR